MRDGARAGRADGDLGYAKYEVSGEGAEAFLSRIMANKMPAQGRIVLTPMLNERGKLIGDFTVGKLGPERFIVIGSGPAENYHMRWFTQHKPSRASASRPSAQKLQGLRSPDRAHAICSRS